MFYCSLCGCAATSHEVSKEWKREERKKQQEGSKRRERERQQRQQQQQQQQQQQAPQKSLLKKKEAAAYKVSTRERKRATGASGADLRQLVTSQSTAGSSSNRPRAVC
jgi:transcription initiation factor TFIID subunit TAF12